MGDFLPKLQKHPSFSNIFRTPNLVKTPKHPRFTCMYPLWMIFNASLNTSKLPLDWKRANITPIFKKGCRSTAGNYRPVSLTSVPCKLLESIIREELLDHLNRHQLIDKNQHGFVNGKSCLTNLLETLESVTKSLDNSDDVDVIYLDYQKAFDSVSHAGLLKKLQGYGIKGHVLNWIRNFLTDRKQTVIVRGKASTEKEVLSGVPQGSVLGPLLFILYVNDLPGLVSSNMKLFADDSKIFNLSANSSELQTDLNSVQAWSDRWLLKFNETKCKVIHFGHGNSETEYKLKNTVIGISETERDLGVLIDKTCKPSEQCSKAAKKANQKLGYLKRTFKYIDTESFKIIYNTYVRPILEYCVQAWNPYLQKDIDILEKVQRRATKLVPELKHLSYEDRLKRLKLYSLKQRRVRGDLIETFKILKNKYNIDSTFFFKLDTGNTQLRGHNLKIHKPHLKKGLLLRHNFFTIRTINSWNQLPQRVIDANTVETFKHRLDTHWQETARYGTIKALPTP